LPQAAEITTFGALNPLCALWFNRLIGASEQSRRDGEAERWRRRWLADGGKRRAGHPGPKPVQVYRVQS